jgi:hypothetical protein
VLVAILRDLEYVLLLAPVKALLVVPFPGVMLQYLDLEVSWNGQLNCFCKGAAGLLSLVMVNVQLFCSQ